MLEILNGIRDPCGNDSTMSPILVLFSDSFGSFGMCVNNSVVIICNYD